MAVTDPCKEKQPRVIDNDLLYKCINSQFPKGKRTSLFKIIRWKWNSEVNSIFIILTYRLPANCISICYSFANIYVNRLVASKQSYKNVRVFLVTLKYTVVAFFMCHSPDIHTSCPFNISSHRIGEMGRLIIEERIPLNEVEEIRLEFQNILRIDHLWVMSSLTKLHLNNNMIEKIENLETLVHLRELDLSFNKIAKIENLETLTKLVKFTIYDNLIEKIENMDNQKQLTMFSIGKNKIEGNENVYYLRRFRKLKSLNMAHNPCAKSTDFRLFIAACLPRLVYYEYKWITLPEFKAGKVYKNKIEEFKASFC